MGTSSERNIPFGIWLVQNFLPAEEDQAEEQAPITNREFYVSIGMVLFAFGLYCLLMRGVFF